jgi:hypothetical protein
MPRGVTYDESGRRSQMTAAPLSDPFGAALLSLLEDASDVASERVWQEIPRLIAAQWGSFTQHQSPLSTMGMIARACETVLKIRVAAHRGGGEEETRRLEEFQRLMADIWEEAGEGGGEDGVRDWGEADQTVT